MFSGIFFKFFTLVFSLAAGQKSFFSIKFFNKGVSENLLAQRKDLAYSINPIEKRRPFPHIFHKKTEQTAIATFVPSFCSLFII